MMDTLAKEISREIDKDILHKLGAQTGLYDKFYQFQAMCQRVVDAAEMFESESLVSYAKFATGLKAKNVKHYCHETGYDDVKEMQADWGQELSELSKQDQFTYTMISKG